MTQIRQKFYKFISVHPEIEKCYREGLINQRSLARCVIKDGLAEKDEFDALIGVIRRYEFTKKIYEKKEKFRHMRVSIKDKITILDFNRKSTTILDLGQVLKDFDYMVGDTLKILHGTNSVKIFIDNKNIPLFEQMISQNPPNFILENLNEICLLFEPEMMEGKGIISTLTREFVINDVIIEEIITNRPEVLVYLKDEYVLKALETIQSLKLL